MSSSLLFADVLIPDFRMFGDIALEQFSAFVVIEVDDFDAVGAEPFYAALKRAAFAHDNCTEAKLAYKAAAIPAWSQRRNHHQIAITSLTAGTAKCVSLAVNAGVAFLYSAVVPAAHEFFRAREDGRANRNSSFGTANARFIQRDCQHLFAQGSIHYGTISLREYRKAKDWGPA